MPTYSTNEQHTVANVAGRALDANNHAIYDADGGPLHDDAAAVLVATLSTGLALTAADFVVT